MCGWAIILCLITFPQLCCLQKQPSTKSIVFRLLSDNICSPWSVTTFGNRKNRTFTVMDTQLLHWAGKIHKIIMGKPSHQKEESSLANIPLGRAHQHLCRAQGNVIPRDQYLITWLSFLCPHVFWSCQGQLHTQYIYPDLYLYRT